ncbi:Retrovirus-related Pol polyprotein LINE-1 [Aphis craccivora]|uniref:Retrovirus-related Pol polyprotein LINE-1 n=1 Tax=Aphis craccivora TaxID=307492 RepID=A0A6G0X0H3_APHCR|nr:Retrovirus-related Pol polyprotein LINE-1 [Aphis craccivora]
MTCEVKVHPESLLKCNERRTIFKKRMDSEAPVIHQTKSKYTRLYLQMLHFADDIALIAESEEALGNMLTKMNDSCKEYNMKINKSKTKILICSKQELLSNITIENEKLETVQCFTYLGSKITHDERIEMDIKSRIAQAKQEKSYKEFCMEYSPLWGRNMDDTKSGKKKIEAFETWCWRRALKISWTEKVRYEEVHLRMNEQKAIWKTIKERRKK